ncbi:MAG: ribose-phosphate pyrophosphokinase [Calditrichia bacterium]|jgi:ribose-phosphate pyrophosphokinase
MKNRKLKIFAGRSNLDLANKISKNLGEPLGKMSIKTFADGEIWVKFEENIRGRDVYLIQSTNSPAENIIELALMIDAAVRASAERVTVVIPYFGYSRQDRKDKPRVPISARAMVDIFSAMGISRIISMDLHSTQIQGFAKVPFDALYSRLVLLEEIKAIGLDPEKTVVLSPDVGSAAMSQAYAKRLGMNFALIEKRRIGHNRSKVVHLIGELKNQHVLIIDDIIDTAGTAINAAEKAMENGALSISMIGTHALLSGDAVERLKKSPISRFIFTDTVAFPRDKLLPNTNIISVGKIFAEAISRIHSGKSVSELFKF